MFCYLGIQVKFTCFCLCYDDSEDRSFTFMRLILSRNWRPPLNSLELLLSQISGGDLSSVRIHPEDAQFRRARFSHSDPSSSHDI